MSEDKKSKYFYLLLLISGIIVGTYKYGLFSTISGFLIIALIGIIIGLILKIILKN